MARAELNRSEINKILNDPSGMVGRDLVRRGRNVKKAAKRFVGKDTRALHDSINSDIKRSVGGLYVRVGSELPYALDHHNGTRRHIIRAKPGKVLAFPSSGRMVFATQVNHPGTRPNLYLTRALPAARL